MREVRAVSKSRGRVRKAQPSASSVHVNGPLTNVATAYIQNPNNFIASRAFAHVPVMHASDLYWIFSKSDFMTDEAKPRAPGTESAGGGFNVTTGSYGVTVYAFHKDIDDQTRDNADPGINLDLKATQWVSQKMLIRKERMWVASYFTTGVWATDVTGVASAPSTGQFLRWDVSTSDPKADILTGRATILASTGFDPRTLVLGPQVYFALQNNAAVKDQIKYTTGKSISLETLAEYFLVDEVLVAYGVYATNKENATVAMTFIAGKNALLCYKAPSPTIDTPSAGYVFTWNRYAGSQAGATIKRFRIEPLESDRIEGAYAYDMKLVSSDCGYFFSAAVS